MRRIDPIVESDRSRYTNLIQVGTVNVGNPTNQWGQVLNSESKRTANAESRRYMKPIARVVLFSSLHAASRPKLTLIQEIFPTLAAGSAHHATTGSGLAL